MTDLDSINIRLQTNLQATRQRIADAAAVSGRRAADITLVAVTKYIDTATTRSLIHCGQTILGESRPQSLWEKAEALADESVQWHLIGHLQRNKVKRTIPYCSLLHSVDSQRLLQSVAGAVEEATGAIDCLLEVNVSGEPTKLGFAATELESALTTAAQLKSIRVRGLMAMASLSGNADENRREFSLLRELRDQYKTFSADNIDMTELSMGMSGDFDVAIEEGSTIVRIGSILFEGVVA